MLGRGLLGIAMVFAVYAAVAAPSSLRRDRSTKTWVVVRPELLASARRALVAVALATGAAAILLWYALFTRDFSIAYVAMNTSRAAQPWYTFSAFWSGMAGSLLLWCTVLSVLAAIFVARSNREKDVFVPWAIPVLAGAELFYLAITIGPENPFARSDVVPFDGRGMNPLLHSPGMLIHPPMLYTGLVGLAIPFAIVVSALINKRTGADWIRLVRRWVLVPWMALGVGLVLGGAWAYTELGWGGYWGWDPVENAAFMPWLAATAFLHSAMVQERRGMLKIWNVFLVTLAATLATFGAFLTRSGLLSSVHTFAESPIGKWFFVFLAMQSLLGLGLLVWRLPHLRTEAHLGSPVSKEGAFLVNNLLFVGAAVVVLWGTVLPLISEAITGDQRAVGPPFFNRVMSPLAAALLLLASIGTVVPWRRGSVKRVLARLSAPAIAATAGALVTLAVTKRGDFAGVLWICALLGITSVTEIVRSARARARIANTSLIAGIRSSLTGNPRRFGGYIVHLGVAITVIGFAGSVGRAQTEVVVSPGERFEFAGTTFAFERLERFDAPDKEVNRAIVHLLKDEKRFATMQPQLNFHTNWDQPQSEIAIRSNPAADTYLILAGVSPDGESVFRLHRNPLVFWVWTGAVVALFGALIALFAGRRVRSVHIQAQRELEATPR